MTLSSSLALFGSMLVLALLPGPGILIVVARTLGLGLRHGVSTSIGIVVGDFVFITLAFTGLTALSKLMGDFFLIIKYLGAAYLVWLGLTLLLARGRKVKTQAITKSNSFISFVSGLLTTLGNPKAILFYVSFFPAFFDLASIRLWDMVAVYGIAFVTVGGVMVGYAYTTHKAKVSLQSAQAGGFWRYCSGVLLMGSGVFIAVRN